MKMDEQSEAAAIMESELELLQLLPALPFKWEGPSATISKGGILCMVVSRVELASLDLAHLQLFPSNTPSNASLDAAITSSTQISSHCTNVLPVFKTKAVLDVEQAQSSEHASLLRARSRRSKMKVMSMDDIALAVDHLVGRYVYPGSKEDRWEMKQTLDGTGMSPKETKSSPISKAKHQWQEIDEAKFILYVMPWELSPLAPLMPFKISAAVPFKWEDAPGKPKLEAVAPRPNPRLQLPPRLNARPIYQPFPDYYRHSKVKHIFHSILPWSRRPGKATKYTLQERDDNTLSASANSQEALSPVSIIQGFDTQSQASSTSPDIYPTLARSKDLACTAHRQFSFRGSSWDPPSSSWSNLITPSSSPSKTFGPVHGTKGSRHLRLAVEHIKEAVRSWKRSLGRRKHIRSMDFDGAEVWSSTLAMHYQRYYEHETESADELQNDWKDQNLDRDEVTRFDNKFEQPPKKFSANQTISSPRSFISDSVAVITHSTGLITKKKKSLQKWIVDKLMQRSYFFVRRHS